MQKPRKFARGTPTNSERSMATYPFTKTEFRRFRKSSRHMDKEMSPYALDLRLMIQNKNHHF